MEGAADTTDLGDTAEDLDLEDPGLQDLARCVTEHALRHDFSPSEGRTQTDGRPWADDTALPEGRRQACGRTQTHGGTQADGSRAAPEEPPRISGQQITAADPEMQMLQVKHSCFL